MERGRALVRDLLADDERLCLGALFCHIQRQVAAGADVLFDLLAVVLSRVLVLRLLAEAVIRTALFAQQLGVFAEQVAPLGLDIRADRSADVRTFVVVKPTLRHCLVDHIHRTLDEASLIGVLDAQDERTAVAAGDEPGIQRRAEVSDVHIARGAGGEAGTHLAVRDARFHLLKKIHNIFLLVFALYHIFSFAPRQCFVAKSAHMW